MIDRNLPDKKELEMVWEQFIEKDKIISGIIRDEILESWKRSRDYGVDPYMDNIVTDISDGEKHRILNKNKDLIATARSLYANIYDIIQDPEFVMFLTDSNGFVLDALGEGDLWEYCQVCNAVVGSSFNEKYCGTTAQILAMRHDKPYEMMGAEHYCLMNHIATCSAAPIHDEYGTVIGSLNLATAYEMVMEYRHALLIVTAGTQLLDNQLRLQNEYDRSFLSKQYLEAAMKTMSTGVIILNARNETSHINTAAERILDISAATISGKRIETVIRNNTILDAINESKELNDQEVILQEAIRKPRCLINYKPISTETGKQLGSVIFIKELKEVQDLVKKVIGLEAQYTFKDIKGESKEIKETIHLAGSLANSPASVLIVGESGTGKEMLAQSIHNESPNSSGPFLAINCTAIPRDLVESELFGYEAGTFTGGIRGGKTGKLELANQGTLFLDEINGMSLDMQAKLLRVLEEKQFQRVGGKEFLSLDTRIIAATNQDLLEEIDKGNFRSDLYYRLNVFEIHVPALRVREGDIELLAHLFIHEISRELGKKIDGITPEAIDYLRQNQWPGNVRQLRNWIERAVNLTKNTTLTINDFSKDVDRRAQNKTFEIPQKPSITMESSFRLDQIEAETIKKVLENCNGNISLAADTMGISRATLYRKMKKYKLALSRNISIQS